MPRVLVAMSGGVDSSAAAALLKEQGYDVVGATMRIWDTPPDACDSGRGCCGFEGIEDARRVCHKLDIPHYALDFRKDFQRLVVDDFISEYAAGRTPNPCIRCNRFLKFDILLKKANSFEAGLLATGHYARVQPPTPSTQHPAPSTRPRWLLKRPADSAKDQTYFLYSLTQHQLKHTLFPLGDLTKREVRDIARRFGLVTADKKESQEVCFAPKGSYPDFLKTRFPELSRTGPILDTKGNVIGRHEGIIHFTIGQRRRIRIARPEPLYVVAIDPERNAVTVGYERDAYVCEFKVTGLNYISIRKLTAPVRVGVQIRYRHKPAPARLTPLDSDTVAVRLDAPQWAVTPGQAAVFYDGDMVVGGGIISHQGSTGA